MKRALLLSLLLACSVLVCGASRIVTNEVGRTVTVPDHPHRIICLVLSITSPASTFSIEAARSSAEHQARCLLLRTSPASFIACRDAIPC
jgi:hypothetical protein